jgi:hypothetical protein
LKPFIGLVLTVFFIMLVLGGFSLVLVDMFGFSGYLVRPLGFWVFVE